MMRWFPRFEMTRHALGGIDGEDWFEGRGLMVVWGPFLAEIVYARRVKS